MLISCAVTAQFICFVFAYVKSVFLILQLLFRAREGSQYPPDATIDAKQFVIRDFVVSSSIAVFGNVTADGTKVEVSFCFLVTLYIVSFKMSART